MRARAADEIATLVINGEGMTGEKFFARNDEGFHVFLCRICQIEVFPVIFEGSSRFFFEVV